MTHRFHLVLAAAWLAAAGALSQESPPPEPTPTPAPEPPPATPAPSAPSGGGAVNPTFFNPSIAVIGNFLANVGHNPVQPSPAFQVEESEISLQAVVDPYARADVFLSFTNDGVEVEEGYVTFLTLPWQLQAKAGKFLVQFGKINELHLHVLPWVDEPLPMQDILLQSQFETWGAEGISVSKLIELPGDTYSEAFFQVLDNSTAATSSPHPPRVTSRTTGSTASSETSATTTTSKPPSATPTVTTARRPRIRRASRTPR